MATSSAGRSSTDGSTGTRGAWRRSPAAVEQLARGVFVALVVGSLGAFFVIQGLKHAPKPIPHFKVQPSFEPARPGGQSEQVTFELAKAEAVTVTVVGSNEKPVQTLLKDRPEPANSKIALEWHGVRSSGVPAPAGIYEVIVKLLSQNLEVRLPESFALDGPAKTGRG